MVSEEEVRWGYRLILGREPESEQVIAAHTHIESVGVMRDRLFKSAEFLSQGRAVQFPSIWVTADVLGGCRRMRVNLSDTYVSFGCLLDDYEPLETGLFRALLRENHVFLDIGANIGWYTLVASTVIKFPGRILAFEPRPDTAANLRRTIAENNLYSLVDLHEAGLAESAGSATLIWETGTANPGGSHLATRDFSIQCEHAHIKLMRLDDLELDGCDIIKMDVEGAEFRVINGGEALLQRHQPIVLSELHPEQLQRVSGVTPRDYIARMADFGYECRLIEIDHPPTLISDFPEMVDRRIVNVVFTPQQRSNEIADIISRISAS
jgi:FkbM family methyltransferase